MTLARHRILFTVSSTPTIFALATLAVPPLAQDCSFSDPTLVEEGFLLGGNPTRACVATGDIDGDGDDDIVLAIRTDGQVRWFENEGLGASWATHDVGALPFASAVDVADMDMDGDLDVVSSAYPHSMQWFRNDGAGSFSHGLGFPYKVYSHAAGDLDGDGDTDLVIGDTDASDRGVHWLRNDDGAGTVWSPPLCLYSITGCSALPAPDAINNISDIVVEDVNGDGELDVLASAYSGTLSRVILFENQGNASDWTESTPFASSATEPENLISKVATIDVEDMDGDGARDLLFAVNTSKALSQPYTFSYVWSRQEPGGFAIQQPIEVYVAGGSSAARSADLGDFDADGDLDFLALNTQGLEWFENAAGDGSVWGRHFVVDIDGGLGDPDMPRVATAADFDGDGDADAAHTKQTHSLYVTSSEGVPALSSVGPALAGTHGEPQLAGASCLEGADTLTLRTTHALENTVTVLIVGFSQVNLPLQGGTLVPDPNVLLVVPTNALGEWTFAVPVPAVLAPGTPLYFQDWIVDPAGPFGFAATNGVTGTLP